ncbi:hypothetical protein OAK48_02270 [Deltaproteobacteria bacterium]|nr:hypothetical protein [Deltaproteobacteria bacterium]
MSDSYYKTIDGKHYDREMLEIADEAVAGAGDGRISVEDAQKLLGAVKDANKYTDIEKATMKYIRENYKFTYAADQWFRTEIRKWAATKVKENDENLKPTEQASQNEFIPSKSYYRIMDGEHFVRSLLEAADVRLEGKGEGLISEEDFQQIIELSRDGKGITETEMRTIEYIGLKYNLTTKAKLWFKEHLEQIRSEVIKSNKSSDKKLSQAINKEQEKVLESDPNENKKTTTEYQRPIVNGNNQKSLLLVHVLWATLLLISIITVRSIYIDQVVDADQNFEKLLAVKQNNNLLEEQLKIVHIEKNQLESKFQGLEQSMNDQLMKQKKLNASLSLEKSQSTNMNDQLMKQKKLDASLSLEKSQSTKQTKPEVIVFKPDQNNCCFCACGTSAFEESL